MAASDVTLPQDGRQGNVKVHPYLISFVRWCVSCVWSTATVFLHRIVASPLPQITAREQPKLTKPRQASTDHLHPEPKVECVVLHTPPLPTLDVIFVHGLYGSLGNTWRQGDWRTKHKLDPTKTLLRNHPTQCNCTQKQDQMKYQTNETYTQQKQMKYDLNEMYNYETDLNETKLHENVLFDSCFQKIFPNDNNLITEQFYNNNLLEINVNNYETQAKFVTELFKNDCNKNNNTNIDNIDTFKYNFEHNKCECVLNETCVCENETDVEKTCDVGCGCVCDDCYSYCWPKDWIKEDFPGARVISINYTSDPYLWRPLWVKENKRLRLHERAEQMMEQLLSLGVGQRPIIWVGHSKGGLFIKQIYCEAYEAYLKLNNETKKDQINNISNKSDNINNIDIMTFNNSLKDNILSNNNIQNKNETITRNEPNSFRNEHYFNINLKKYDNFDISNKINGFGVLNGCAENDNLLIDNKKVFFDIFNGNDENNEMNDMNETKFVVSSIAQEDTSSMSQRASLWSASAGFMFYSVPHRGSPLADIKTPITARSVELMEIAKDCSLVLELQDRWLEASRRSRPQVRSLVETCRTLMSVLWLRIVSVDSADAGIGSLHGVSVDHREICKPSSRKCLLYTELTELIAKALNKCSCS